MENKTCTKCNIEFPSTIEYFHKRGNGLRSDCKKCNNAKNKKWRELNPEKEMAKWYRHPEKVKDRKKIYYKKNHEKIKTKQREWRLCNPERVKEYSEAAKILRSKKPKIVKELLIDWRFRNPEKDKSRKRLYYKNNAENLRAYSMEYRKNNPEIAKSSIVNLSDGYVAARMNKKISEIPVEMIEMKRIILLLKRELGIGAGRKRKINS